MYVHLAGRTINGTSFQELLGPLIVGALSDPFLQQSKTDVRICIPCVAALKQLLERTERRSVHVFTNGRGRVWAQDGFRCN
jgi:hypothetical protein